MKISLKLKKKTACLKLILFLYLSASSLFAESLKNEIILSVSINGEKKGDFFCLIDGEDLYIPLDEFLSLGLKKIGGKTVRIEGKDYLLLNSWEEASFTLNEERLELEIILPPEYLPETVINLQPGRRRGVIIPSQNSLFLNYRFDYSSIEGVKDLSFNHELGIHVSRATLVTEGFYNDRRGKYIRLNTYAVFDNRRNLTRLILGDFFTPSGPITYGDNMFGISYQRNFSIDPYFLYRPAFNITTYTPFKSELEIYLDGSLIRKEIVPPGGVTLSDLYYYGGRRDIQLVIRDPFGRVQTFTYPYYFSDQMLKKGTREFNYSVGFLRENYYTESNDYGDLRFFAFERYGYSDNLTLGARVEGVPARDFYNAGVESILSSRSYGVLSLMPSFSRSGDLHGAALSSSYNYQFRDFGFRLTGMLSTRDYRNSYFDDTKRLQRSFSVSASYYMERAGSLSAGFTQEKYSSGERKAFHIGYSKSIKGRISLYASYTRRYAQRGIDEFFAGISIYPKRKHTVSARYETSEGRTAEALQVSKTPPLGEGYGYRITAEREKTSTTVSSVNPYFQYRSGFGVFETDISIRNYGEKTDESYRLTYSGALVFAGDRIGITRPVNNSFALIKAADLKGVTVYLNGQKGGRTGSGGYIFLPELTSYYNNTITLNDREIPFEYTILTKEVIVSPWFKSGFCLSFPVKRVFRYTGFLIGKRESESIPLEYYDVTVERPGDEKKRSGCMEVMPVVEGGPLVIPTGKGGEFYIEVLTPGTYRAKIMYNGTPVEFDIVLPETEEFIADLGNIEVALPGKKNEGSQPHTLSPPVEPSSQGESRGGREGSPEGR